MKTVNTMFDLDAHSNSYLVCVFMTQRSHFSTMRQQSMQFKKYGVVLNMGSRNRTFLSCVNSEKLLNLSVHRRRAHGSYLRGTPWKLHESTAGVWGGGEWQSLSVTSIYDLQRKKNIPWKYLYVVYNSNSSCPFSKCLLVKNRPKTNLALQPYPEMETYPLFKSGGENKDLH